MLTRTSAVLIASVVLCALTGVFGVAGAAASEASQGGDAPRNARLAVETETGSEASRDLTAGPGMSGPGMSVPEPSLAVDSSLLPKLGRMALLSQLAVLPADAISSFMRDNRGAVSSLLAAPPTARAVASWWNVLPEPSRSSLALGAPQLVGNLDGVPADIRDTANRVFLDDEVDSLAEGLDGLGRAERADSEKRLHMLREIQESLVTSDDEPERSLLSVDTQWPGRAAVVVGDLETADFVSFMVPGMFFTVDGQMVDWTVISQDLHAEQVEWVETLGRSDPQMRGATVATVSWIGYQTPGVLDIASLDLAKEGAVFLSNAVAGVQQTRVGDEPYLSLMTHSYGSTATMIALADGDVDVDSLVIIGSPGSAAQSVDELGMTEDTVFVGEAAWDPVVDTAFFGSDPGADSFGASAMDVSGGIDPITGVELTAATGHLGYFDAGTEAMRNMALVGLDRGDLVVGSGEPRVGRLLAQR
ncbi:MAG: hypothetical protein RI885_2222 [Actinomycetota bacterium]